MRAVSTPADYRSDSPGDKPALQPPPARPDDLAAVEEFLQLLARTVRHFHTYPPASPLCTDAVDACHKAFAAIERHSRLVLRITASELFVDEVRVGAHPIVDHELVRRLHRAHITSLAIDRNVTPRHLAHFCSNVIRSEGLAKTKTTLAELLAEHGVDTIVPVVAKRPEVLDVGIPPVPLRRLVEHEQRRRPPMTAATPVDHLYPPDKGWVRLDPASAFDTLSLVDLAVLVDDPVDLAGMLLRLTDDDATGPDERSTALERKFSDVTTLFASLDTTLAAVMFSKLARAVLRLEPERRTNLLRRTILPGLLDGRADGAVLRDFPDVDLADALCILLELETAAPEVLTAALNRLDLPPERQESVIPLIDDRLKSRADRDARSGNAAGAGDREIDRLARRLVSVEASAGKDFSEFSAFDLSIDDDASASIAAIRGGVDDADLPVAQLGCLVGLVRLEPNPAVAQLFLRRVQLLLGELERSGRLEDVAAWAGESRRVAAELRQPRPDVADAIAKALLEFLVPARVAVIVDLHGRPDGGRRLASALVDAFGEALVPGVVALADDAAKPAEAKAAMLFMCDHAPLFAAALASAFDRITKAPTKRAVIRALGFAGSGHEALIAQQLADGDDQIFREAVRALARIGTAQAAAAVSAQIEARNPARRAAAEEALWHFPPARAAAQVRELLGRRDFVVHHPQTAARLLDRAAHAGADGLDHVLAGLESLRFRFWSPSVVRVALRARELRVR
jgi:hypothetical protein